MNFLRSVSLVLLCLASPISLVPAEETVNPDSITLNPPLAQAMPLTHTDKGVQLSKPILLSLNCILTPQATLRVCYIRPQSDDPLVNQIRRQQTSMGNALARQNNLPNDPVPLSPEALAAAKIASRTTWTNVGDFQHAFAMMNLSDLRLVYADDAGNLSDEVINLPEGLLLAEDSGRVKVLAVQVKSGTSAEGFQAGDQLLSIDERPLSGTLADFVNNYRAAKADGQEPPKSKMDFKVQRDGETHSRLVSIGLPPTLKSLMDQ